MVIDELFAGPQLSRWIGDGRAFTDLHDQPGPPRRRCGYVGGKGGVPGRRCLLAVLTKSVVDVGATSGSGGAV
jgi:hypothetical protein